MRRVLAICCAAILSVMISAGSEIYVEKFLSSERAHLNNLMVVPSMAALLPGVAEDIPGFGLKDSKARYGEIRYQVQGASQVTIKFFSVNSSFASRSKDSWIIGMPDPLYEGEMLPVYMDPAGALYIHDGNSWRQLQKEDTTPWAKATFNPVSKAPESVASLNINVRVRDSSGHVKALTGSSSNPIPLLKPSSTVGYYEERTYKIPENSEELIIGLNYPWEARDLSGNAIETFLTAFPVIVSKIEIEGENLIFDQTDPDPGESSSGSGDTGNSGGNEDYSDDEIILPENDPEHTQSDHTEMPISSEESALLSSSSSESDSHSSKSSSGSKKTTSGSKRPEKSDRAASEPESETLIYQADQNSIRDKLFSLMLAGYGVIGLGIAWQIYLHTIRKK